jgi:hypothetical protein
MPVSLAVGTVQTPEFVVNGHWYWILLQVERPLPNLRMRCMMAVTQSPSESEACPADDPLLRADWMVRDGGQIVDKGSSTRQYDAMFDHKYIFKFLGKFGSEAGKRYVMEVKFTKDGTPLNVANPHLIVVRIGDE